MGHTALGRAFKNAGLGSVAEFIRQEQLRLVVSMLRNTQKPIAEIAEVAGFISITHFANFIKKRTGTTARSIRQCGRIAKSSSE
jgi:AraC-like DNA-binding protein